MFDKEIKSNLYEQAVNIIDVSRNKIATSVVYESAKSYYLLGKLIVENDQSGNDKAEYGKYTISNLSKNLVARYGKGFSVSTLKDCRKLYIKSQTLSDQLSFELSFSHYSYLIRLENKEFEFYQQYAISNNLSVRQLQQAVQSNIILRLPEPKNTHSKKQISPKEIIKDPYVLDFLGLDEVGEGQEKLLENKLVEHLEKFLLELGRGFAFVGRQYRLTLAEDSFWADLVFYNIPLKCYVIFELKTRKLKHSDLGQLQMYVNYFDREIKDEKDNSTIGILLCKDKNQQVVEYTLPQDNQTIFTSKFSLYLPTKEELGKLLEE